MITKSQWENLVDGLTGKGSRKVVFGSVLFYVSSAFLAAGRIGSREWLYCALAATLLIGFGTILDDIVRRLGDRIVDIVVSKLPTAVVAPAVPQ